MILIKSITLNLLIIKDKHEGEIDHSYIIQQKEESIEFLIFIKKINRKYTCQSVASSIRTNYISIDFLHSQRHITVQYDTFFQSNPSTKRFILSHPPLQNKAHPNF